MGRLIRKTAGSHPDPERWPITMKGTGDRLCTCMLNPYQSEQMYRAYLVCLLESDPDWLATVRLMAESGFTL